jgi:hypothetical protein
MRRLISALLIASPLCLAGCDMLGVESASAVAARHEAEGRAVGAGCRHAARSVEQCYALNKRAEKAAVFAGWREMNDYMRENKLEAQPAEGEAPTEVAAVAAAGEAGDAAAAGHEAGATKAAPASKKH